MNLLNEARDSRFLTRNSNIVNDQSNTNYDVGNEIICNTEVLKSNLYDHSKAYILVRGNVITTSHSNSTQVAFKHCAPFVRYITKNHGITTVDDVEDLDLVMPMCNLIEYSLNSSSRTGSLWFYSKDEATTFDADIADA